MGGYVIDLPRDLAPVLYLLGRAGAELAPHPTDPARLRHRPEDVPRRLAERLRECRPAVLRLLADGYTPGPGPAGDAGAYIVAERLGIAEGLGLPIHPGSPAWLVAVGEAAGR